MIDLTTEDDLQKAVARILDASGLLWFHYPAENQRRGRSFNQARCKGVKKGVPDVMIHKPFWCDSMAEEANGLAIELKIGKRVKSNEPKPEQLKWLADLRGCGWRADVCHTLDEVLVLLEECYGIKVGSKPVSDLEGLGRKR